MLRKKILASTLTSLLAGSALAGGITAPANAVAPAGFPFNVAGSTVSSFYPGLTYTPSTIMFQDGLYVNTGSAAPTGKAGFVSGLAVDAASPAGFAVDTTAPVGNMPAAAAETALPNPANMLSYTPAGNSFVWSDVATGYDVTLSATLLSDGTALTPPSAAWTDLMAVPSPVSQMFNVPVVSSVMNPDTLGTTVTNTGAGMYSGVVADKASAFTGGFSSETLTVGTLTGDNTVLAGLLTFNKNMDKFDLNVAAGISAVTPGTYNIPVMHTYTPTGGTEVTMTYMFSLTVGAQMVPEPEPEMPAVMAVQTGLPGVAYNSTVSLRGWENFDDTTVFTSIEESVDSMLPTGLTFAANTSSGSFMVTGMIAGDVAPGDYMFDVAIQTTDPAPAHNVNANFMLTVDPLFVDSFGSYNVGWFSQPIVVSDLFPATSEITDVMFMADMGADSPLAGLMVKQVDGMWMLQGEVMHAVENAMFTLTATVNNPGMDPAMVTQNFMITFTDGEMMTVGGHAARVGHLPVTGTSVAIIALFAALLLAAGGVTVYLKSKQKNSTKH